MRPAQSQFVSRALAVLLAGLLMSCTANKRPSSVETALANMAKDVAIPIEAGTLQNPLSASEEVATEGQQIYTQSCALCHGADGRGHTVLGRDMYPPAMDLNSPHVQHWKDAELFWIIQNGVRLTGMPAWKSSLSDTDTWKVVNFLRSLPKANAAAGSPSTQPPPRPGGESQADVINYGRTLYRQEGCFACHRLDGEGSALGPDLSVEGTRGRSVEWLVGHFRNPAKYTPGSVMPPFPNLTEAQLQALTAFLQNQKGQKTE